MTWLAVAVVSFLAGGVGVPLGFVLSLPPIETFVAATLGSVAGLWTLLLAGDGLRRWIAERRGRGELSSPRVRALVEHHGAKGLGLVGPLFPGVTASVVVGLALGLHRNELGRWLSLGSGLLYGIYTVGLWLILDAVG